MSKTNFPAALPLFDAAGKPVHLVTHANNVIDGVNRNNPVLFGSITLNAIKIFSTTTTDGVTKVNPLAIAYGGTGNATGKAPTATKLATARTLRVNLASTTAASFDGSANVTTGITGVLPITKGGTGSSSAAAALTALGAASAVLLTASIPVSWTANAAGGFIQTVSIAGIKATDVPVVGIVLSSDIEAAKLQSTAFSCVNRITTAAGSITLYAYNTAPTTAISLQLLVVRGY